MLGATHRGQLLAGGSVPFITHSRSATRRRLTSAVAGTGFALSVPVPQLLPGQFAPVAAGASFDLAVAAAVR